MAKQQFSFLDKLKFFSWATIKVFFLGDPQPFSFSKRKRVGFMYTLFAIVVVSSIAFLVAIQSNPETTIKLAEKIKSDEVFYFMRGIDDDLARSGEIAGKRALLAAVDIEISKGYFLLNPKNAIRDAILNGSFNNTLLFVMENSTLQDWEISMDTIGKQRDINSDINITALSITDGSAFAVNATINASIKTHDPVLEIKVEKNNSVISQISIEDIEDSFNTLYSNNEIAQIIKECSYLTASQKNQNISTNWAAGKAIKTILTNLSLVSNSTNSIAVVPNGDLLIDLGNVEGIVSEMPSTAGPMQNSSKPFVANVTNAQTIIPDNELIIIDDFKIYQTNVTTNNMTNSTCYFHNPNGPSFLSRLKGNYDSADGFYGISSFIYVANKAVAQDSSAKYYPFPMDYDYWDRLNLNVPAY